MSFTVQQTGADQGFLKILSYGEPGAGKTRFIGSAEPKFKTLILSAEAGLLSLKDKKIDFVNINTWTDLIDIKEKLKTQKHQYNCVAIDSLTEVQRKCMIHILGGADKKPQIQDWGTLGDRMMNMITDFRDMPINVIMTALVDQAKDESTGEFRNLPLLQGSLQQKIAGYFDEVFFAYSKQAKLESGEVKYVYKVLTRNTGKHVAKDRSGKLADIEDPDFCQVHEKIFGSNKGKV